MLPLVAAGLGAGASIIDGINQQEVNGKRQAIVKQGQQAQQGFRGGIVGALGSTMQNMGNVQQLTQDRTQAVNNTIGNTLPQQGFAGATSNAYLQGKGRMALGNAARKSSLAQALGGMQGFQASNSQDAIQRGQFGSQLADINRQSQQQLFQDQQRMNAVRPNAGMQFLSEGLRLGSALGGVL